MLGCWKKGWTKASSHSETPAFWCATSPDSVHPQFKELASSSSSERGTWPPIGLARGGWGNWAEPIVPSSTPDSPFNKVIYWAKVPSARNSLPPPKRLCSPTVPIQSTQSWAPPKIFNCSFFSLFRSPKFLHLPQFPNSSGQLEGFFFSSLLSHYHVYLFWMPPGCWTAYLCWCVNTAIQDWWC